MTDVHQEECPVCHYKMTKPFEWRCPICIQKKEKFDLPVNPLFLQGQKPAVASEPANPTPQ